MGIEVFFTGLIMICLDGELNCSKGNIAWVVKADGKSTVCGRESKEETELELRFPEGQFVLEGLLSRECKRDANVEGYIRCPISKAPREICLGPDPGSPQRLDETLRRVSRIDEVDRRFKKLDMELIDEYAPTVIRFPHGTIAGGDPWPPGGVPRKWSRSNDKADKAFPRYLSDRLKVTYKKLGGLELTDCHGQSFIKLTRAQGIETGQITFRNSAKVAPSPDRLNGYDNLAYLIWYYRLGSWATKDGKCPVYADKTKDAVMLRCLRGTNDEGCAFDGVPDVEHTKWPSMRCPNSRRHSVRTPQRRHSR